MELRQLEYFVTVVEEANFTRAAARLHVAQPGVSAQIRQLERELGHALLDRSGRGVRLTEVGAAVLPFARAALGAVDGAKLAVDQLAGLLRGKVAIGMVTNCPAADLTEALAAFHKAHPAVEITLSEDNSDRLLDRLRDGRLDLALVGLAGPAPTGIATQVITDQELVAAVAHGHVLAARTSITLAALGEHPLISLPVGTGLRASLDNACAAAGLRPRIAFEASDPRVLGQLAGRGLGVAILPEQGAREDPDLHVLAIVKPRLRARLELAWRAPAGAGFAEAKPADQALRAPAGAGFAEAKPADQALRAPAGAGFAEAKPADQALRGHGPLSPAAKVLIDDVRRRL